MIFFILVRSSGEFFKILFFILKVEGAACHRSSNSGSHAVYVRLLINVFCTFLFRYFMHKKAWQKRKEVAGINDRQQYVLKRINSVD